MIVKIADRKKAERRNSQVSTSPLPSSRNEQKKRRRAGFEINRRPTAQLQFHVEYKFSLRPNILFFSKFFFSIFQKPPNRDLFKNLKITQLILLLKKKMFKVSVKWRQVKIVRGRGGSMTLRLSDYTDMAFDYSEAALNVTY